MLVFVCDHARVMPSVTVAGDRVVVRMPPWLEHEELAPWIETHVALFEDHEVGLDVGDDDGKAGLHLGYSVLTVLFLRGESERHVKGRVRTVEPPSA